MRAALNAEREQQRPTRHEEDDERPRRPEGGTGVMGARREVGDEVQHAGRDVAVEEHTREAQRRVREEIEESRAEKEGDVLQIVQVNATDPIDGAVRPDLPGVGVRVERRLPAT